MNKITAADSIRRLATQYQDMMAAADLLEEIGSLEQASKEAKAATHDANVDRASALAELAEAREAVAKAQADATDILQQAKFEADIKATDIKIAAEQEAATIRANAEREAAALLAPAQARLDKLAGQARDVENATAAAQNELGAIRARIALATEEADAAEKRLAEMRAAISKLVEA
jgi:predicted  nucleic acid-binding Zn-ribbon protein